MAKAAYANTATLPTAEKGDTFTGWQRILKVNGVVKDLTGATIVLTLKQSGDTLTTVGAGGITIVTPTSGVFKIDKQLITFAARKYNFELVFTFADADVKTYIEGTWTITD